MVPSRAMIRLNVTLHPALKAALWSPFIQASNRISS
jgi:hypothetical protein